MSQDEIEKIKNVKNRHLNDLMSYSNVTGVGIGYKEVGVKKPLPCVSGFM